MPGEQVVTSQPGPNAGYSLFSVGDLCRNVSHEASEPAGSVFI